MRLRVYCLLGILCSALTCYCQNPPGKIRPLSIGDTIPADLELTNVYNYPVSKIRLSDLKGKLVILDFWSTWCGACIESFPKMHELQNEFIDKLQIVLVNTYEGDDIKKVKTFFDKRKSRTGMNVDLPYSISQSSIAKYFPYKYIPHYVWIGKDGKVAAITSQTEVTSANIASVENGIISSFHTKKDLLDFNFDTPLFVNGNGGSGSQFIYRSLFTNYIEGIGNATGFNRDSSGSIVRFYMFNSFLPFLIRTAYGSQVNYPDSRIVLELGSSSLFYQNASLYNSSFCYELFIPPSDITKVFQYFKDDLYRMFKIRVFTETRPIKCLSLKSSPELQKSYSKGGKEVLDMDREVLKRKFTNQPIGSLVELLNTLPSFKNIPVIDETGLNINIDIDDPPLFQDMDIDAVYVYLKKMGFIPEISTRDIDVAVITDKF